MPELPEVETTKKGIAPHVEGAIVSAVVVRQPKLRWPVTPGLDSLLIGKRLLKVERRAKYLLLDFGEGWLLIHLGMSGSLRVLTIDTELKKHDHIDISFTDPEDNRSIILRYHDPRRFGAVLWIPDHWSIHPLLAKLGPEPLTDAFNKEYLYNKMRTLRTPIKTTIMDQSVVVGVGNIYASESLFSSKIHPQQPANTLSVEDCELLVREIKQTLLLAIQSGGSTLRDYVNSAGDTGYFQHVFKVYDRAGEGCVVCNKPIELIRLGQRSTFFCSNCQSLR